MNYPEIIYKYFDKGISPLISTLVPMEDISRRLKLEQDHHTAEDREYILTVLTAIHDRASSMVSHLSLMLGVCLFLLQAEFFKHNNWIEQLLIIIDSVIYIGLVLLSVRCLRSFGLDRDYQEKEEYWVSIHQELVFKYSLMQIINSFTLVATVFLVIALLFGINA